MRSKVERSDVLRKAAALWVDMERGLYDWRPDRQPRHADGTPRVVKTRILTDLGFSKNYLPKSNTFIFGNPEFLAFLKEENSRRDYGIANAVAEIEAVSGEGPLTRLDERLYELAIRDLEEDPESLATKDKIALYLQTHRLRLEMEGKVESAKQQGIEHVIAKLAAGQQVTNQMVEHAMSLVREYRAMQDRKLADVLEGELDE